MLRLMDDWSRLRREHSVPPPWSVLDRVHCQLVLLSTILYTGCSALNGNKIKHISEMKAHSKLCTSSFSVVILPDLSRWSRSSCRCSEGEVKILMMLLNISMIHRRPMCGALWWKTIIFYLMIFSRSCGDWWHVSGCGGEQCFVPCPWGNSSPVTELLSLFSCHSGRENSWSLGRKRGTQYLAPSFSRLDSSGFLLLEICKGHCL
jgi:hypothetical protein